MDFSCVLQAKLLAYWLSPLSHFFDDCHSCPWSIYERNRNKYLLNSQFSSLAAVICNYNILTMRRIYFPSISNIFKDFHISTHKSITTHTIIISFQLHLCKHKTNSRNTIVSFLKSVTKTCLYKTRKVKVNSIPLPNKKKNSK